MDYREVAKHNSSESCWVVLYGNVYDVTEFLPSHPGGSKIILQLAGQDATDEYDPVHPPGTLEESLPASANLGKVDESTLPAKEVSPSSSLQGEDGSIPSLESLLNIDDMEEAATKLISRKAWDIEADSLMLHIKAYYYSAGDDLISKTLNNRAWRSILLRPRVFIDCTNCSTATQLLSNPVQVPIFISPAAMARLAHPDGEKGMAAACATYGAAQIISNNASQTPEQIVADASPDQVFGWQMYVQTERAKSEAMLARINKLPAVKFVVITLDAPVPGKREHDERMKNVGSNLPVRSAVQLDPSSSTTNSASGKGDTAPEKQKQEQGGGIGQSLFAGTAPDLRWATTLPWVAKHTSLPIVLKGLQTHEDAYLASLHTPQVKGIILSNHGGRAMDTAPPAAHTLLEIRKYCPEVFSRIDVFVDGGIKRGTDVVKALCLGAKGVGLGRAPLWGLGVGGQAGVERVFEKKTDLNSTNSKVLKAEIETCMRLLGVESVDKLGPKHINSRALEQEIYDGPAAFEKLGLWVQSAREAARAKAKL